MKNYKEIMESAVIVDEAKGDPVSDLRVAWLKSNRNNKAQDFDEWIEVMLDILKDEGVKGPNQAYKYLFGTEFKYGVANPADLAMAFANYMKKV